MPPGPPPPGNMSAFPGGQVGFYMFPGGHVPGGSAGHPGTVSGGLSEHDDSLRRGLSALRTALGARDAGT